MNVTSHPSKAVLAWIVIAVIAGLSLTIGFSLFLIKRHQRRKHNRNAAYTETVKLEQKLHEQHCIEPSQEQIEKREKKRASRWQILVNRFGNADNVAGDIEAQTRPTQAIPSQQKVTQPLPAEVRLTKPQPTWQGRVDATTPRAFQHMENSVVLEDIQARRSVQRERIFQHVDTPGRFSQQPLWGNPGRRTSMGTNTLRNAYKP